MGVTLQIEIPEFDIERLQAHSAQHGLSLDDFIKNRDLPNPIATSF